MRIKRTGTGWSLTDAAGNSNNDNNPSVVKAVLTAVLAATLVATGEGVVVLLEDETITTDGDRTVGVLGGARAGIKIGIEIATGITDGSSGRKM
ncbi:hypothetical protein N7510_010273 [Penicillium lagena]|uniref:uncharacterized protein n=1 Tax=Penicillium lagena TaxID=94218 RepID=UPI0025400B51|nr:uncharacterized protein N7510_010273 [Penicillium lagena]KAJ5605119.1 hypothetical protein N7510_010273 [Penicillium lagena]